MQEQLISFETAKLAKEKGFNWGCYIEYEVEDYEYRQGSPGYSKVTIKKGDLKKADGSSIFRNWNNNYSAPTQSLLQKWLREKHKLYVYINPTTYGEEARYSAQLDGYGKKGIFSSPLIDGFTIYNSYEEALEEGLHEALKLI
jgi:hypothetical protein